ncbi:MAG: alpha/beta fold hydrolase [Solirubrobacterales bacterium]
MDLGGLDTRVVEMEGEGQPILFLHGFADSADTWRPTMAALASSGRAAAAIDLAGFGAGSPPLTEIDLLPQWDGMVADAIRTLSAHHDGAEVFVAGNSLGGCLAIRAAQEATLPLAGVVPIAPAGLHMARWFPVIESQRLIRLLARSPLPIPELVVREFVGRVYASLAFADPGRANPSHIASFTRHIPNIARGNEILELGRRLLPELEDPFDLEAIDRPLLLVWGESDRMVYTTGAERVLRTVPYADIEILPDCGHCPQLEVPERLAEMLLGFPEEFEHAG